MSSSFLALIATMSIAGTGPIPQRIGATLQYETRLPRQSSTRLDVRVVDTTRTPSGLVWGLELSPPGVSAPGRVELLQRPDNSWTWRRASCMFPVDVEPVDPSLRWSRDSLYTVDYNGTLALACTDTYRALLPWRKEPASPASASLYDGSLVEWVRRDVAVRTTTVGTSMQRMIVGFEYVKTVPLQSTVYRPAVGWVRVEDKEAAGTYLKLRTLDGQAVPESWDPPPPPPVYPVLTPQPRPKAGSIWVWRNGKTSIQQDIGIILSSDSSFDDTLVAKLLEVRDSAGWSVGRFHHRDGIDAPPRREFTLAWNDTTVRGDLDSASELLRRSLVRPKVCWQEARCEAPTTNSWSNGLLGNNKETMTTQIGTDWEFGVGVTFWGTRQSGFHGTRIFADSDGWLLLYGPDSVRTTTSVETRRPVNSSSLSELAQGNPEARFSIWTFRGERQILSGSALAATLPSLRGPLLWSVRLDGTLRTGKHLRP